MILESVGAEDLSIWIQNNYSQYNVGTAGDSWKTFLASEGGSGETFYDLESSYLASLGYSAGDLNDSWAGFLSDRGYGGGSLQEGLKRFFVTGTISTGTDPSEVSNMVVRYDANAITGLSDTDAVSQWDDSSPNTYHATQGTGAAQPTYRTGILNSKPVVRFDGTDDVLTNGSFPTQTDYTVYVVYANRSTDENGTLFSGSGSAQNPIQRRTSSWWRSTVTAIGTSNLDESNVFTGVHDFTNNAHEIWLDGVSQGTSSDTNANVMVGIGLGARNGDSEFLNGDIAELIIYSDAHNSSTRQGIESFLQDKWGL